MNKNPEKKKDTQNAQAGENAQNTPACGCAEDCPTLDELLDIGRRGFLTQASTLVLGAVAVGPAVAAAASTSLNPIRGLFKHSAASDAADEGAHAAAGGKSYRVADIEQLTENGAPVMFSIADDMMDGWVLKKDVSIGAVWVQRLAGKEIRAFQALCPHAGCPIMYDDKEKQFYCPCHAAFFQIDGVRFPEPSPSPSPRDMDTLEAVVAEDGSIMVAFQRFKKGTPLKIAEG